MENPVLPSSCVTPAGTSIEVQNEWEENTHTKHTYAIGSVLSLSGHAIVYRWRSLPRVRRHRASKAQGSSERVLPWQVTMDQLVCASLSHTHYGYEVGMLKVPASIVAAGSASSDLPASSPSCQSSCSQSG